MSEWVREPLWVVGGEQRVGFRQPEEWSKFKTALVVRVEGDRMERVLEYQSPPAHCPDEKPSFVFKAATVRGDTAWLCTQTEVLECGFPDFAVRRVISLPCFNDLHHVTPGPEGTLFVAVTGLDAVAELTPDGELIRLVSVLGGDVWDRFSRDVDYRKVPTTKPHQAHPNHVFFLDGEPWVTRFQQRDAVPVDRPAETGRFPVGIQGIHDGHVHGGRLWFTTVDGHVVRFGVRLDQESAEKTVLDLNTLSLPDDDRPLGWCRGILPLDDRRAWVGFTRIRYTKLRQNLSWVRHGFRQSEYHRNLPTRIALYDLDRPGLLEQVDLEGSGLGAIFSIHRAEP
ncbi:MAG TPA: hypothetical protein VMW27_13945 [Thermoanaerobaculia bacterium]|nr:hypothetical protein [Thermoanaerobaculia bacterium]